MKFPASFPTILLAALCAISACKKDDTASSGTSVGADQSEDRLSGPHLPVRPYNYANITLPAYLTTPPVNGQVNPQNNGPITDNGATLGRVLFYDKSLSVNNKISCASCHKQDFSFSDPQKFSVGFEGGSTARNSMSLVDARFYPNGHFFWDERAASAEAQASGPITSAVEMGMTMPALVAKLQNTFYYPDLFQKAYGSPTIDSARIVRAIAMFVRSIVSYQSKYDAGRSALPPNANPGTTNFANFTAQENQGKAMFFNPAIGCAACHGTETFTAPGARNNGLDLVSADLGKGAITGNPNNNGEFKVPSLRNVEKSAPYMHDGRFNTLEEVIEHYSTGVKNSATLSPPLRQPDGQVRLLNLNANQKAALVAFLKTLTDNNLAVDPKYSNPF